VFRAAPSEGARASPSPGRRGLAALTLALAVIPWLAVAVLAAEPSPLLVDPLDPRAEGEGPGIVGAPLAAAVAVIALGLLAAALTLVYVRFSRRR
jgi:hypothetical protein